MQNRFLLLKEKNKQEILEYLPEHDEIIKIANYFQNFSDYTRLKIISCLTMSDMCVNDISEILGVNQTTISHQLKFLKTKNVVGFRRSGKIIQYYLLDKKVNDLMLHAVNSVN